MKNAILSQTKSGLSAEYCVRIDDETFFAIQVPAVSFGKLASVYNNNGELFEIRWDIAENKNMFAFHANKRKFNVYRITSTENKSEFGIIYRTRTKTIGGYSYYVIDLKTDLFYMYEVGLGKDGIKLPVLRGDEQIALLEKETLIVDNLDTYSITYTTDESLLISVLFGIYYDFHRFGNRGEYVGNSKRHYFLYTSNKELKAKYDTMWGKK